MANKAKVVMVKMTTTTAVPITASPVSIEKSADLEMDGSGESGGFSRTVGGRIAYKSKDAGHTWLAV